MNDKIIVECKTGGYVAASIEKLRTPRAVLGFALDCLYRGGRRAEIIAMIQKMETHLGLDLGRVLIPVSKRRTFDEK